MKKLVCFPALIALMAVLFSCGTAHKIESSLKTSIDSLVKQKKDSASVVKTDSVGKTTDLSLVTTQEHTQTVLTNPGFDTTLRIHLAAHDTIYHLSSPGQKSKAFMTLDAKAGNLILNWGEIPSTTTTTTDKTTTEHKNVNTSSAVSNSTDTKTKSNLNENIKDNKAQSNSDKTESGLFNISFKVWIFIVIGLVILAAIVIWKVRSKLAI